MRRLALLTAAVFIAAVELAAADYGSLSRVVVSGKIYTAATAPTVATAVDGSTTFLERLTVTNVSDASVLRALVDRGIITTTTGYQLGLINTAALDIAGEFVAFRPAAPATTARRVPTDLLSIRFATGPREGSVRNTAADALISVNLTSRDYATLSVLDFEGTGIFTQRYFNNAKLKSPQNQVIQISGTGSFSGVNAPDSGNNGVGTLAVSISGTRIVDLALFGDAAPRPSSGSSTSSGSITVSGPPSLDTITIGTVSGGNLAGTPPTFAPTTPAGASGTLSGDVLNSHSGSYTYYETTGLTASFGALVLAPNPVTFGSGTVTFQPAPALLIDGEVKSTSIGLTSPPDANGSIQLPNP